MSYVVKVLNVENNFPSFSDNIVCETRASQNSVCFLIKASLILCKIEGLVWIHVAETLHVDLTCTAKDMVFTHAEHAILTLTPLSVSMGFYMVLTFRIQVLSVCLFVNKSASVPYPGPIGPTELDWVFYHDHHQWAFKTTHTHIQNVLQSITEEHAALGRLHWTTSSWEQILASRASHQTQPSHSLFGWP